MNIIAILDVLIIFGSFIIGSFVFIKNPKNQLNRVFYILMLSVALWNFIEFQLVISQDINSYLFWDSFDFLWILSSTILFHFAVIYTNSAFLLKYKIIFFMYASAFFSMLIHFFFVFETNLILVDGVWKSSQSGFSALLNDLFLIIYSLIALFSFILCILYFFKCDDKLMKKKTLLIVLGLSAPIIGAVLLDAFSIPFFIDLIPISTNHFIIGTIIFFSYAIWRYDVFSLEFETVAENIVTMMSDALFLIDENKKIIMMNNSAENMTGYNEYELISKPINKILLNKDQKFTVSLDSLKDLDTSLIAKNENIIPVSYSSSVIKDNNDDTKGYIIIIRDISDRKRAEAELTKAKNQLEELNNDLEKRVIARTSEVNRLLKQKDDFINQLGHDLKTPLTPIVNLIPYLIKKETDPKKIELLNAINSSSNYMKDLVIKTIHLTKLNSSNIQLNFEKVALNDIVEKSLEMNSLLINDKNIKFDNHIDSELYVNADILQLKELLNNLLVNSIKYSNNSSNITINASDEIDSVKVSIKDDGIGMTEEQQNMIFDEYYKADESRHELDSSGLGLSICKKIVEKHGGRIWVESEGLGKGSTFYFTIPKNSIFNSFDRCKNYQENYKN